MNENLVEQVSSSSGIPQMLVSRSAQARAEASGVSVDDVLNSWTGGEAIQSSPASETVPSTPEAETAPVAKKESLIPEVENVEEELEQINYEVEKTKTAVLIKEDFPPPVNMSEKLLKSLKFGLDMV